MSTVRRERGRNAAPPEWTPVPEDGDVLVVGGGIAGLAVAFHLGRAGVGARVLEREPVLAAHASGRNAAIFRHVDGDPETTRLALRSRALLASLGEPRELLRRTGALYLGDAARLRRLAEVARRGGVEVELILGPEALARRAPALLGGRSAAGLFVPEDGVLDGHALVAALARDARARGVAIETGVAVDAIVAEGDRLAGVRLAGGRLVPGRAVVIAAGAWAGSLGATCDAPAPLLPLRRHLVLLGRAEGTGGSADPTVWSLEPEVYFRPESGGILASPCDEEPSRAESPSRAPDAAERLARRLASVAPGHLEAGVRTSWSCLRTFAPDRRFLVGRDARRRGLFWIAGLGGRGMTCALALGEALAAELAPVPSRQGAA